MVWETLGATILGLAIACAAVRRLPERLPHRNLTYATGPAAALLGALVSRAVLGPGHTPATLLTAVAVSVAILSLLLGEKKRAPARPRRHLRPPEHAHPQRLPAGVASPD